MKDATQDTTQDNTQDATQDWTLTEEEFSNLLVIDDTQDFEGDNLDEYPLCDLRELALQGDIPAFKMMLKSYEALLYKRAAQNSDSQKEKRDYVDHKTEESKKVLIASVDSVSAGSVDSNRKILAKAVDDGHSAYTPDAVYYLSKIKGVRYLRGIVAESKLTDSQRKKLVINSATTFTNLLSQVKKMINSEEPDEIITDTQPKLTKSQITRQKVQSLKSQGFKQKDVVEALGVAIRTVKGYWND